MDIQEPEPQYTEERVTDLTICVLGEVSNFTLHHDDSLDVIFMHGLPAIRIRIAEPDEEILIFPGPGVWISKRQVTLKHLVPAPPPVKPSASTGEAEATIRPSEPAVPREEARASLRVVR